MAYLNVNEGRIESKAYKGRKLTPKMLSFIDMYFGPAGFNAIKAMEMSDYKTTTPASTHQTAAELMLHPLVIAEIERRQAARSEKLEVKAEYLINKLINIIDNFEDEKTADRLRAIELAGKSIGLFKERQEISGPDGQAIQHEQRVKESVDEFTSRILSLAQRQGADNVVSFTQRGGTSGA